MAIGLLLKGEGDKVVFPNGQFSSANDKISVSGKIVFRNLLSGYVVGFGTYFSYIRAYINSTGGIYIVCRVVESEGGTSTAYQTPSIDAPLNSDINIEFGVNLLSSKLYLYVNESYSETSESLAAQDLESLLTLPYYSDRSHIDSDAEILVKELVVFSDRIYNPNLSGGTGEILHDELSQADATITGGEWEYFFENNPPVANAGQGQVFSSGDSATLDGSLSEDDNSIQSYLWEQVSGPEVTLNNSNQVIATYTVPNLASQQDAEFKLTVTDSDGEQDESNVIHTFLASPTSEGVSLINLSVQNAIPDGEYTLKVINPVSGASTNFTANLVGGQATINADFDVGYSFQGMLINSALTHSAGVKGVTV